MMWTRSCRALEPKQEAFGTTASMFQKSWQFIASADNTNQLGEPI